MSLVSIPLDATRANQTLACVLDGKTCVLNLTTTDFGLFADVTYNGSPIVNARRCQDRRNLNPYAYLGMPQPLFFADLQGTSDPVYTGFNTRYLLCYGTPDA